jgi:hypothetical protein
MTAPFSLQVFSIILLGGLFDASIGLMASLGLLITTMAYGSFFSLTGFTAMIIVTSLWSGLGVMVGKVRLFVKDRPEHLAAWYERLGDFVIGTLLVGYLGLKFIGLLAGVNNSLGAVHDAAEPLALSLMVATAIKYFLTTAVSHFYPARMLKVYPTTLKKRPRNAAMMSLIGRGVGAFFLFTAFLGFNWLVMLLLTLYLVDVTLPDAVKPSEKDSWIGLIIPSNLGKILFLSVASAVAVLLLEDSVAAGQQLITVSLIVVMVVAIINNVAAARWPSHPDVPDWVLYVGGFAIALLTYLQLTEHLIKA